MDFRELPSPRARAALRHVAALSAGPALGPDLRLTLNFHPDRLTGGLPILRALAQDGTYHSQFVTGTSNGGLTAHPGGDRWRWESRIFGGAYDQAAAHDRPVYGALNFRRQVVGAAPRFGSSHFRLTGAALHRATFCYPDSAAEPAHFGVAAGMSLIALAEADEQDALNDYIEAQVHGGVVLSRDVEALVLDASYRGTPVEASARLLRCPIEWHPGYRLTVTELRRHADYRGQEYAELGARIAQDGRLDPRIIGDAARTGRYELQDLKMVWHTLARFGAPEGAGTAYSHVEDAGRGRPKGRSGCTVVDSWERARNVLAAAGLPPGRLARVRPLTGGTYNTVEELLLTDGSRYVLKVPPAEAVPGLRHEKQLLLSEAEFYRAAAQAGVPAPRVVAVGSDNGVQHLLMTACPGDPWDGSLTEAEQASLRGELGRHVALLHRRTGPGFGYPSGALGPLAPDWRAAFTAMTEAVLDDARHYRAGLPRSADETARTIRAAYPALDEVTVPRLVHFDLWQGNILVDRSTGTPRIGGLIDGERMFWGDPLADFVSLALLGDIRKDEAFLMGYQEAGGRAEFDPPARLRLALYRSYLYIIMLTETIPRAVDEDRARWVQETVGPELVAALDEIAELVPAP